MWFPIMTIDEPTVSGRVYSREAALSALGKITDDFIRTGEYPWVDSSSADDSWGLNIERMCGKIKGVKLEGNELLAEIEPIDSPCGIILTELLKAEVPVRFHTVGSAMVNKNIVGGDYHFSHVSMYAHEVSKQKVL